jgi:TonB-linked SusC/RagA family outer membrane protein
LWAQNKSISGTVTDENNEPVAGASVSVKNTTTGTITDFNGKYTINAPDNATLVFSLLGYTSKEEKVNGRTTINVALAVDEQTLGEVVVEVGYGTQRKVTLAGAVSGVKGTEMRQTKNENPQNMLTGKIAGVRVWQKSAEPGVFNSTFDIRGYQSSGTGDPLVVIDGIPRSMSDFQRLNANDIDDISVLKDASAAIYGVFAANGVVLVTTKKGDTDGKVKFSYNGTYTFQKPSGMPVLADPFETMTLYNERAKSINNDGTVVTPIYGEDKFQAYRDGTLRSADWTSLMFSDYSPQTQHDVSISGGNNKVQYYVGLGYFAQEGFFKSGDLNYNKYNLRSNIGVEVIKGLKAEVNLSGYADQRNTPYSSAVDIIRNYWRQGVLFPAYADPEQTMLSYEGLDLEENSVAKMTADVSGYHKYEQKNFQSSAALTYDLGTAFSVLKGLSAKVMFSYDYRMDDNTDNRKEYYQYMYNKNTDSYDQKLYNVSHPNRLRRTFNSRQQVLSQFLLNYNRSFGDHKVNGFVGWEAKKQTGNGFYGQNDLAFASDYLLAGVDDNQLAGQGDLYDYAFEAVMGRANYSFADRYIIEGQFRYDGSSKLAPGHQWTFFPSASLAWRVSEEPFFKSIDALSFVNQLKLRASYGVMGNDNSSNYEWLSGYTYPATSGNAENGYYNQYVPGYIFDNQFIFGVGKQPLPNISYTWEMSKTFDVGADFEGWNGLFGFTVDYFDRRRSNIGARRTGALPTAVGSTAPLENLNSDRQFGLELELTHRNKIQDFSYKVKGIATITRRMFLTAVQNGPYGSSYLKWRGDNLNNRYQGVQFGYESAGRFQNWEDIWSYPQYTERDVLPGDYKYIDWNGDGEINGLDAHPYAFDQTPWLNFSLGLDAQYKNFDLNILFQGSALGSMEYTEPLYSIWGSNGGGTLVQYLDRWHPVDPTADLYNYTTEWIQGYYGYTGRYPRNDSQFNRVSTAYLRLKSVELGYTIPRINALKSMRLRVFANAYNLFTITGVKFVDPEHPDSDLGRLYPLNKTYTVGLSLSF